MAVAKVGIIYSTVNKIVRRVVVPDGSEDKWGEYFGDGESILVVDQSELPDIASATELMAKKLGVTPGDPSCAIVDSKGNVVGSCLADPLIDQPPKGHKLVAMAADDVSAAVEAYSASLSKDETQPLPDHKAE